MLTAPEKELIRRLLIFVNSKKISSARKVERLFENIPGMTGKLMSYEGDLRQPRDEQTGLRKALSSLATHTPVGLEAAIRATNDHLEHVQLVVTLSRQGEMGISIGILGITAVTWYAVALIIDRRRGVRERLAQCGSPGCGKFVLRFGRGRPWRHCSESHRRKADKISSRGRSQRKRDIAKAERLLRRDESVDYVRGAIPNLERELIERIAERVRARQGRARERPQ
jgi:hypothetical protein